MDSVKEKFKTNGSFKTDKNQTPRQRWKVGTGNSRIEYSPISPKTQESVVKFLKNKNMELRQIKGRSLGVYLVIPEGSVDKAGDPVDPSTHFRGYMSFNDSTTQLTMDDYAEDILEKIAEGVTRVKSEEEIEKFIDETSS